MMSEQPAAEGVDGPETVGGVVALGRHRRHMFPARSHAVKVLYGEQERATVEVAAELADLRLSSYVAAAALLMAQRVVEDGEGREQADRAPGRPAVVSAREDRELLAELIRARLAVRRYGVNVNQAAAMLNRGGDVPVWLEQAIAGGNRAVARVDDAAAAVARRLA